MMLAPLVPITIVGGLFFGTTYRRRQSQLPSLATQLMVSQPIPTTLTKPKEQPAEEPFHFFSTTQHLALSAGLFGTTTAMHWGIPLLRAVSLPGLLYLDLYFVGHAIWRWRATRKIGIEINDAVLATGLLATGQLKAEALFATLFFISNKLQERTIAGLVSESDPIGRVDNYDERHQALPDIPVPPSIVEMQRWQQNIDRGALPLLVLSAASIPFLGLNHSLGVLLANFGYDYRVLAPLSTLSFLKVAHTHGIHVRSGDVFEKLHEIDVVLVDTQPESDLSLRQNLGPTVYIVQQNHLVQQDHTLQQNEVSVVSQIARHQAEGHKVAYVGSRMDDHAALSQADLVIWIDQRESTRRETKPIQAKKYAQVIIQHGPHDALHEDCSSFSIEQTIEQLFALAAAHHNNHQRSLIIAIIPSVVNLWGIYLWHLDVVGALVVDYGGMGLGLVNALLPEFSDSIRPWKDKKVDTILIEQQKQLSIDENDAIVLTQQEQSCSQIDCETTGCADQSARQIRTCPENQL